MFCTQARVRGCRKDFNSIRRWKKPAEKARPRTVVCEAGVRYSLGVTSCYSFSVQRTYSLAYNMLGPEYNLLTLSTL
jgi:hypothetical protein